MDYRRIYYAIIENRRKDPYDGYTEKHHIIPKSSGGDNSSNNIVALSAREHFLCHYLLTRFEPCPATFHALHNMRRANTDTQVRYINARLYEANRIRHARAISKRQKGTGNSQYGTVWVTNGITNKKQSKDDSIAEGWYRGRVKVHSDENINKFRELGYGLKGRTLSDQARANISKGWEKRRTK